MKVNNNPSLECISQMDPVARLLTLGKPSRFESQLSLLLTCCCQSVSGPESDRRTCPVFEGAWLQEGRVETQTEKTGWRDEWMEKTGEVETGLEESWRCILREC